MKNNKTRLERLATIVEDSIEKLLKHANDGEDNIYLYRYNFFTHFLYEEIDKNLNIDTSRLKVSKFAETLISNRITFVNRLKEYRQWHGGWKKTTPPKTMFGEISGIPKYYEKYLG